MRGIFLTLYKTLVRSHLDFSCAVWSPMQMKTIDLIEGVQRRATKQIPGFSNLSYPDRLKKLKLPTLSCRRVQNDMIEVYKIVTSIYDSNSTTCLNMCVGGYRGGVTGVRNPPFTKNLNLTKVKLPRWKGTVLNRCIVKS